MIDGETGEIKIAWLEDNPAVLYSKMFDDLDEAQKWLRDKENKKHSALVFHKMYSESGQYAWQMLPFGNYSDFFFFHAINQNKNFITTVLGVFIALLLAKKMFVAKK